MSLFRKLDVVDKDTLESARVTLLRQMVAVSSIRLLGSSFPGTTIDSQFWASAVAGTGAITQTGNQVTLATGSTANSSAQLTTSRNGRFMSGTVNWFRGVVQLDDLGAANNVRRWGVFNDDNGAFFQLSGTTLSVVTRKATVDTVVAQDDWNGNPFTLDTNANRYEIVYLSSTVQFYVDDILVHSASFATAPWTATLNLNLRLQNTNSGGGTADVNLKCRAITVERFGEDHSRPTYFNINGNATNILKRGAGTLHRVILNGPNTSGTVTIYDNTAGSGSIIATIDMAKSSSIVDLDYNVDFSTGLTVVTAGTPGDITIIWD